MNEQTINGTRVVFRDKIPAKYGWDLILPMNRLSEATQQKRAEIITAAGDDIPENVGLIPAAEMVGIVQQALAWPDIVRLVQGAVQEWDFDGDLSKDTCCDGLNALRELWPIIAEARAIFWGIDLSGEVDGGSTNT